LDGTKPLNNLMKKKTPKRKPSVKVEQLEEPNFLFDEVEFVSLKFIGRFPLAWFFLRKAVESLIRGKVII